MNAYKIIYHNKNTPWDKTEIITMGEESTYHVMELFNEDVNYDATHKRTTRCTKPHNVVMEIMFLSEVQCITF